MQFIALDGLNFGAFQKTTIIVQTHDFSDAGSIRLSSRFNSSPSTWTFSFLIQSSSSRSNQPFHSIKFSFILDKNKFTSHLPLVHRQSSNPIGPRQGRTSAHMPRYTPTTMSHQHTSRPLRTTSSASSSPAFSSPAASLAAPTTCSAAGAAAAAGGGAA